MSYLFLKILSGKLKGKNIVFYKSCDLRPTTNRIRIILFDWLKNFILKARVLDLFSGTGILGFEFLSRGASAIFMLENNTFRFEQILFNKNRLDCEMKCSLILCDSYKWICKKKV
ncbi:MAG: RsmD family RNA methyltransferase [Enterobacteriaceae bacterium]|nr:RsmD family RNA methyltransferase [Enterobacteriaceae bacterium]